MKRLIRYDFVGFLIASRIPNLIVIGATQYLTAFFLVSDYPNKLQQITGLGFFGMVVSTVMIAAGGYIINDYYDQKIDMINRPQKVVVGTMFRRRLAMLAHFLLTIGGIGLGFYLDIKIGVLHIVSSFFLWYYSNYLRRITLIGNVIIAMLTGLTLLIVTVYLERNEVLVYIYSLFAMAIILIREVLKDIEDVKGDATFGCQSIPVIFGIRGAKLFIYLVCLGSAGLLVSFLITTDIWLVRYYFLGLVPIFLWFIYRLVMADRQKEFNSLVRFTNLIILSGLVSMILIKTWI
ncbi:MAG: geranylgeranylglycerol-phosphate geranylgeranyltransferase [Marinoscillum sp.]|uniref:geranylgeranylglycerol-phosphate geranylgeranyltransferase n=1 Tax=Marinoscillum sp. TaxID=2024838 RepID=UPI0032FA41A6